MIIVIVFLVGLLLAGAVVGLLGAWHLHEMDWEHFNYGGTDDE